MKRRALTRHPLLAPLLRAWAERNLPCCRTSAGGVKRPFALHDVGGDGIRSVAEARHAIETLGIDGIVHLYPFKCMPEMIAKTALVEVRAPTGALSALSFDKRWRSSGCARRSSTFAAMLRLNTKSAAAATPRFAAYRAANACRRRLGRLITRMWIGSARRLLD